MGGIKEKLFGSTRNDIGKAVARLDELALVGWTVQVTETARWLEDEGAACRPARGPGNGHEASRQRKLSMMPSVGRWKTNCADKGYAGQ